jgi:hypothetical protein
MITFFTHCRPFTGEFDDLQRRAVASWRAAVPGCEVITAGNMSPGLADKVTWIQTNRSGTARVDGIFNAGNSLAGYDLLCEISSDIVLDGTFLPALEAIADIERPFVVGQRHDQAADGTLTLHPPSAADYFIFRRGTLGDIPPFAVGRNVYDQWLIWAALERWSLQVIDATEAITAVHINHSYPEYGSRELMVQSDERQENIRLADDTGCTYWAETNNAPWMIRNGKVEKR